MVMQERNTGQTRGTRGPAPNPVDAKLIADPAVAKLWSAVEPDWTALQVTFDRLSAVTEQTRVAVMKVLTDDSRTPGWKAEHEATARAQGLQQIETIVADATRRRDAVLAALAAAEGNTMAPKNAADASVFESRLARAWARYVRELDALPDNATALARAFSLATDAATAGDLPAIEALREELPAYFVSRKYGPKSDVTAQLNYAIAPMLPPQERAATQLRDALQVGFNNLTAAIGAARRIVSGTGDEHMGGLPGWRPGDQITL